MGHPRTTTSSVRPPISTSTAGGHLQDRHTPLTTQPTFLKPNPSTITTSTTASSLRPSPTSSIRPRPEARPRTDRRRVHLSISPRISSSNLPPPPLRRPRPRELGSTRTVVQTGGRVQAEERAGRRPEIRRHRPSLVQHTMSSCLQQDRMRARTHRAPTRVSRQRRRTRRDESSANERGRGSASESGTVLPPLPPPHQHRPERPDTATQKSTTAVRLLSRLQTLRLVDRSRPWAR